MFRVFLLCATALFLGLNVGCATIITGGGSDQSVSVKSIPPGADIWIDGTSRGKTPLSVRLDRRDTHYLKLTMSGYQIYEKEIQSEFNGWMVGNVVLGGVIGVGVDAVSGASKSLNPTRVNAMLVPIGGATPVSASNTVRVAPTKPLASAPPVQKATSPPVQAAKPSQFPSSD